MKEATTTMKVRFGDCDPLGHLNNVKYLEYMLNAREDHVELIYGFSYEEYTKNTGCTWVTVQNEIAYFREVRHIDKVEITSRTIEVSDYSMKVEILLKKDGAIHSVLWITVVHFNLKTRKAEPHSPETLKLLANHTLEIEESTFAERAQKLRKSKSI